MQPARAVVQIERLRDQVYSLIRDDLKSGEFAPGQRLLETDLAARYGVSRTPVREALFQLSRDGLLAGSERGYIAPIFTRKDIFDRLEVKRLLAPRIAQHVATSANALQLKLLTKHFEQEKSAAKSGNVKAFNEANHRFRSHYYLMCENRLLADCALLIDDQFSVARNRIHEQPENREISIDFDQRLLAALVARDAKTATAEVEQFHDFLTTYFSKHAPGD